MYYYKDIHRTIELYKAGMGSLDGIKGFSDIMKKLLTYKHIDYKENYTIILFEEYKPMTLKNGILNIDQEMYDILWKYIKNMEQDELLGIWRFYLKKILYIEFEDIILEKYI